VEVDQVSRRPSIHISTVNAFFEGCRRREVDPVPILARVGEPGLALDAHDGRFPTSKVGDLLAAISTALQDETLGFLERPTAPGGLELWIHSCITSRTLGEAIARWILYWRLIHADQHTVLETHGDQASLTTEFTSDPGLDRSSFITWKMFLMLRLASWLIGKPMLLDRLHFTFPDPADRQDYDDMFPARHYFGQAANSIVFNKRYLDMPVVRFPEQVGDFVANLPHLMSVQRVDHSLTARIRRMLQEADHVDEVPLSCVSRRLNRSEDTLRRHLKSEGSTFSEIKESVRRDMAVYHLRSLATPINEIAYMLGFSEPSAFNRAFKRWTGQTPGDYRRHVV
jgi:AraC-like DNA-binding protein